MKPRYLAPAAYDHVWLSCAEANFTLMSFARLLDTAGSLKRWLLAPA